MLEPKADSAQHQLEIIHHAPRLRLDAGRKRRIGRRRIGGHLAGHEYPAIGLHRVGKRRHRPRTRGDHVMQ
ncbi:hypothetical protein D3C72_2031650 [compost metagenome]